MRERPNGGAWGIILAGGSGRRLVPLTTRLYGRAVPKQFAVLYGKDSLLQHTVRRLGSVISESRIVIVVPQEHDELARAQLASFPRAQVLTQPRDRGTGPGLALPLAWIRHREANSTVVVSPADHFIHSWEPFAEGVRAILDATGSGRVALLGVQPERAETQYGWILPGPELGLRMRSVAAFREKPDQAEADRLLRSGALWNTFVFAASADRLWHLLDRRLHTQCVAIDKHFAFKGYGPYLGRIYDEMVSGDFSRDVLQATDCLGVVEVMGSGWSDWGTPDRVFASLAGSRELAALEGRLQGASVDPGRLG